MRYGERARYAFPVSQLNKHLFAFSGMTEFSFSAPRMWTVWIEELASTSTLGMIEV